MFRNLRAECHLQCLQSRSHVQLPRRHGRQCFRSLFTSSRYLFYNSTKTLYPLIIIINVCDAPLEVTPETPCNPSPCGQNSQCRPINGQAVCSCVPGYIGSPPSCRPECVVSSDCSRSEACSNLKCVNPCVGSCGVRAQCQVINHNPICSCPAGLSGDPFVRCDTIGMTLSRTLSC